MIKKGTRVRFLVDDLGASERDRLYACTGETYGTGEEGRVAFRHPNRKACPDWFYVEVKSKSAPGEMRYVGVNPSMVERVA